MMKRTLMLSFMALMAACNTNKGGDAAGTDPDTGVNQGGVQAGGNQTATGPSSPNGVAGGEGNNTFPAGPSLAANSPYVHYVGRVEQGAAGGVRFAWPASGISVRVTNATFITASLLPNQRGENNVMGVLVDGKFSSKFALNDSSSNYTLTVPSGDHTVTLLKRTEAGNGSVLLSALITDGQFETLNGGAGRVVEVVGENATAGYSSDAPAGNTNCSQPTNSVADPAVQNAANTYGVQVAQAFNADWSILAYSGRGLVQNYDGSKGNNMAVLYGRLNPQDVTSQLAAGSGAGVVILNVGTNDINYWLQNKDGVQPDMAAFQAGYLALLQQVRALNPQAAIIATTGPTLSNYQCFGGTSTTGYACTSAPNGKPVLTAQENAVQAAVAAFADSKTSYVKLPTVDSTNVAACYMPSAAAHTTLAAALVPAVAQATGWSANQAAPAQPAAAQAGKGPKSLNGTFAKRPDPINDPNSAIMKITVDEFPQCHYCSPKAFNANNVGTRACPTLIGISEPCQGYCHVPNGFTELYATNPPTSGNHYSNPKPQGFYATAVPRGRLIHTLEHGAVVLSYNCPEGCAAEVAWLQAEYNKYPGVGSTAWVVVTPDPLLGSTKFAAASWTWRATFNALDDAAKSAIDCFVLQHSFYGRECLAEKATGADISGYPRNCPPILDQYMSTTGG